jgi:phosphomannomutase
VTSSNLVVSASGIRGTVYDALNPEVCARLASVFAGMLGKGTYVVGRDTRPSGSLLLPSVRGGIASTGGDVIDVGVCPTPTIQLAVEHHSGAGGVAVTASHNPAEWNALKLIASDGTFLPGREVDRLVDRERRGKIPYARHDSAGRTSIDREAVDRHIRRVLELDHVREEEIRSRRFKVVVDATNGAGSQAVPELLRRLGCEVTEVDCEGTGVFKRNPEPVAANLEGLCDAVRAAGADLGFALDPDADRLSLVDETGRAVGEDLTLAICADLVLADAPGPLVTNLSTSMVVEDVAARHGVPFHRSAIGEINVVEKMKDVESPIGGEGNGGVILPALHYGRDSLVGAALVLEALARTGGSLTGVLKNHSIYGIFKKKVRMDRPVDFDRLRDSMEKEFPGGDFDLTDGIRVSLDRSWLHIRKSGTEPVIRLISEAQSSAGSRALVDKAVELLGN